MRVRDFLRNQGSAIITMSSVQKFLHLENEEGKKFLRKMSKLKFLERSQQFSRKDRQAYEITSAGQAVANASATKPITRKTADRLLTEFMKRVQILNTSNEYAYVIESVVLFGSVLSEKERLGDIDIAIELRPATSDAGEFDRLCNYRRLMARIDERRFDSDFEWFAWPAVEVFRFLRAHSWKLALHDLSDLMEMERASYRVIHGDPARLTTMLPMGVPTLP